MVIYIKNVDTDEAVRLLARRTGQSLTEAIDEAVRERLLRLDLPDAAGPLEARFEAAVARLQSWDASIGDTDGLYDDTGLPR